MLATVQESPFHLEVISKPNVDGMGRAMGTVGLQSLESAQVLLREAGVQFDSEVSGGGPATVIIGIAQRQNCDSIIMGAKGIRASSGALLGSVFQRVLHASTIPITIVKPSTVEATS